MKRKIHVTREEARAFSHGWTLKLMRKAGPQKQPENVIYIILASGVVNRAAASKFSLHAYLLREKNAERTSG